MRLRKRSTTAAAPAGDRRVLDAYRQHQKLYHSTEQTDQMNETTDQ